MHADVSVLVAGVFLACAVEMVEALTIVLATGTTRGWRSALEGAAVAVIVLAVLAAALGPALVHYVPLRLLRFLVGGILLVFGAQWWRKAILRSGGLLAKHDEDAIFEREVAALSKLPLREQGRDAIAFTVSFKGVFLEGLEVIVIVITLGSTSHRLALAAATAGVAVVTVAAAGLIVSRQLSRVPENAMKMVVSFMLVSFGSFWSGEGIGVRWPGSDLAIPVLACLYAAATAAVVALVGRGAASVLPGPTPAPVPGGPQSAPAPARSVLTRWAVGFATFWWEFLIGDTPELFAGTLVVLGTIALVVDRAKVNALAVGMLPALVLAMTCASVLRARWLLARPPAPRPSPA